jgi:hypothetical protein
MTRTEAIKQIGRLLDGKCQGCTLNTKTVRNRGALKKTHNAAYCIQECPVGARLQELGKQLGRTNNSA